MPKSDQQKEPKPVPAPKGAPKALPKTDPAELTDDELNKASGGFAGAGRTVPWDVPG